MDEGRYTLEFAEDMPVIAGIIWAEEIAPPRPTESAPEFLSSVIARAQKLGEDAIPAETRRRVRRMLRYGKYRPSGRGKPASEFLLRAALQENFPLVNCPVDVNNAISLASGLPGSIFDADVAGRRLLLRRGRPGEKYVFNRAGQEIDLEDLLLVCRLTESGWSPCGNPVKDAMETKISEATRNVVAVLYAPADEPVERLTGWADRYAELLGSECGAARSGYGIVKGTPRADFPPAL